MSVALRGNLQDFGIADVFQLIGQQRKTGILEFSGQGEQMQFLFDRGAIVSAAPVGRWSHAALGEMLLRCGLLTGERVEELRRECEASAQTLPVAAMQRGWLGADELREIEDLLTRETIFTVLRWSVGSFDFRAESIEHDRAFETLLGAEQVLMDGLRMVDEWQSFAALVPSEDTVFSRATSFERYEEATSGEAANQHAAAERVFRLVDGRLAVRRIIDLSLLGTFDAVRALAALHRVRVIDVADPEGVRAMRESEAESAEPPKRAGNLLATLLPLAALLAVVVLGFSPQHEAADPFRIARPTTLERAQQDAEVRRLERVLAAHFFAHGRWPSDLETLAGSPALPVDALASLQAPPYYSMGSERGAIVLAPERPTRP